jgi:hypothetical protein
MRLQPYEETCKKPNAKVTEKPHAKVTVRPPFKPFSFCVNVESYEDLASLWARFNMSGEVLAEAASEAAENGKKGAFCEEFVNLISADIDGKRDIWKYLNAKLKEAGLSVR